jgi:hypothetical protein
MMGTPPKVMQAKAGTAASTFQNHANTDFGFLFWKSDPQIDACDRLKPRFKVAARARLHHLCMREREFTNVWAQ